MKAAEVAYARPSTLVEAITLLAEHGEDARPLAGGQSLVTSLNMRLSAPALLVDINHLPELAGLREADGIVRIGAMTRHRELGSSDLVARHLPLITAAVPHIAHPAIRNRGTIGGSLSLADPATELPACCLALGATMIAAGPAGERRIAADDFFQGLYATALASDEILVAIEIPSQMSGPHEDLCADGSALDPSPEGRAESTRSVEPGWGMPGRGVAPPRSAGADSPSPAGRDQAGAPRKGLQHEVSGRFVWGFDELARRHGDYALAGVAATARRSANGLDDARIVLFGVGDRPILAIAAAAALRNGDIKAAQDALAGEIDPPDDVAVKGATRKQLARVLLGRVGTRMLGNAG